MAGPSVLVKIIGDVSGLGKAVDEASSKVASAAGKMSSVFSGALSGINQTGVLGPLGDALQGVVQGLDAVARSGKGVGLAMIGVVAAGVGIGVALSAVASQQQAATGQLKDAIEGTGNDYVDYG